MHFQLTIFSAGVGGQDGVGVESLLPCPGGLGWGSGAHPTFPGKQISSWMCRLEKEKGTDENGGKSPLCLYAHVDEGPCEGETRYVGSGPG